MLSSIWCKVDGIVAVQGETENIDIRKLEPADMILARQPLVAGKPVLASLQSLRFDGIQVCSSSPLTCNNAITNQNFKLSSRLPCPARHDLVFTVRGVGTPDTPTLLSH